MDDLIKQTMIAVYLPMLKVMRDRWRDKVGVGTRVFYWLDNTIKEMEELQRSLT
jgi:hypothetical protein